MNESGIIPVDRRVVVTLEKLEEVTKGGIVIAQTTLDREEVGHIKAKIVATGAQAFEAIKDKDYHPKPGMSVSIAKYSGYLMTGKDGKEYRIINDDDVVAVLDGDWDVRPKR